MLDVNDFKLVPLEALVYDEVLLDSYREMIASLSPIYELDYLISERKVEWPKGHVIEYPLMRREVTFWKSYGMKPEAEEFMLWAQSPAGYARWANTPQQDMVQSILTDKDMKTVYGRSGLFVRERDGQRQGSGFDLIAPAYRGQGLSRVLMAHRFEEAKRLGVEAFELNVAEDNHRSMARLDKLVNKLHGLRYPIDGYVLYVVSPIYSKEHIYDILNGPKPQPRSTYDLDFDFSL